MMQGTKLFRELGLFSALLCAVAPFSLRAQAPGQSPARSLAMIDVASRSLSDQQRLEVRAAFLSELSSKGGFRLIPDASIQAAIVKKNPLREEVEKFAKEQKKRQAEVKSQFDSGKKAYLASEFDFAKSTLEKSLAGANEAMWGLESEVAFQILEFLSATELFLGNEERAKFLLGAVLDLDPSYVVDSQKFPPEFNDLFNQVRVQPRFPMEWVKISSENLSDLKVTFMGQMVPTKIENGLWIEILKGHPFWGKMGLSVDRNGYAPILFDLHQIPRDLEFVSLNDRQVATATLLAPLGTATPSPELKSLIRSIKADLVILASAERTGSGDFQVEGQWLESQSLRTSPVVVAISDSLERSVQRTVSELFDYLSPLGYVMSEKLVVMAEEAPVAESKPFFKKWWAWAILGVAVAGAGVGGYLLLRPEDNLRVQVGPAQ